MTTIQPPAAGDGDTFHPLPCPPWCETDHAQTDRHERYVEPVMDLRTHSRDVAEIDNPGAGPDRKVHVSVGITDDLGEQVRGEVLVGVDGAECMRPLTAAAVARAVDHAARLATGGPAGEAGQAREQAERELAEARAQWPEVRAAAAQLAAEVPPVGDPRWVGRAVAAVAAFGLDVDSLGMAPVDTVEHLLAMWRHHRQLTREQVAEVVDRVLGEPGEPAADLGWTVLPSGDVDFHGFADPEGGE